MDSSKWKIIATLLVLFTIIQAIIVSLFEI